MTRRRMIIVALAVAGLSAVGTTQSGRRFVDPKAGIELRIPRWLEPVPTKPGDLQTVIQFKGEAEAKSASGRDSVELTLLVIKIAKQDAPTTGDEAKQGEGDADPELKSLTEMRTSELNSGKTLPEYMARHGYQSELVANPKYFRKPLLDERGLEYQVFEYSSSHLPELKLIRAFTVEDAGEIFGLVALGEGTTVFADDVETAIRSLRRVVVDATADTADAYADTPLRDADRRRKVRAELVKGWEAYDTENYILVTNVTKKKVIEDVLTDLETLRKGFLERFPPTEGADMSAVSTVRLCDGYDDYLRYAGERMDGTGGYWAFTEEELVLFNPERKVPKLRPWLKDVDALAVLYHEAMHQYFHYSNRQLAPGSWFNEGYGEVFGGAEVDRRNKTIKRFQTNAFRMKLIRSERKRAGSPDLRSMLIMSQGEFYGPGVLVNYANGWSFCYFIEMERQKSDRERNQAWADFADVYLQNLREVTERYRKDLPDNAPDDWIMGFASKIQREAIDLTLKTVDEEEMEDAWQKAVMKWR